ncbi:Zn-ribbon domain-containing OB-fold protein [Leucobacter denitrificans]|uniref:OB-fold domain-containing protein n=1 Tax=Leucobacter denitrificans TaxID=683042 RepID=A0A7G9S305_9MICO|nr:OB-fold domain-containing protein [Leucobacter denitrificans]QNN62230.1 OB-fold domain-containing protein [Leucobacter denitrificans]
MEIAPTPQPVPLVYDIPFWESVKNKDMQLQRCADCAEWRYPAGPICSQCNSENAVWERVSGEAEILSWVVFHKTYLPAYPAPHKVIAVRLSEGPIMISNLEGKEPEGSWIGERVSLCYSEMPDGMILPRFALSE